MTKPIFSLTLFVLAFAASHATAEETAFFANIPIRGAISDDTARFIAENSVTTAALRTSGRLDDLVRENCGFVSSNNRKIFAEAVRAQGGNVDADGYFSVPAEQTAVPDCLPDEQKVRLVGRLPSSKDTLSMIFERDAQGGFYSAREQFRSPPQVWNNPELVALGTRDPSILLAESGSSLKVDGPPSTLTELAAVTEDFLRSAGVDASDRSRLAYEGFVAARSLENSGIEYSRAQAALEQALVAIGSDTPGAVLGDVAAAINTRQQVPQLGEVPLVQSFCRHDPSLCVAEASGTLIRLPNLPADVVTELNPRSRVRDIDTFYANVPIVSATPLARSAKVQLRSRPTLVADPWGTPSTGISQKLQALSDATYEEGPPPYHSSLSLFQNVGDAGPMLSCSQGAIAAWGDVAFQADFRAAVSDAVAAKERLGEALNLTEILILDGGFFRFDTADFDGVDWARIADKDAHSDLRSLMGMPTKQMENVVHGTAVTSLALGGPGLMNLSSEAGLPITVRSKQIYRSYRQREPGSPDLIHTLIANVAKEIREMRPAVVNLSFGSVDDNDAYIRGIKETLFSATAPLLVVAAGNLGDSNGSKGEPVTIARLKPQIWGTDGADAENGGWNMVVVAALDTGSGAPNLAWFSNYGEDVVVLGAPGCKVTALRATPEGTYEDAQFNGTSFAAPIVTFTASVLHSIMPEKQRGAPWLRARLLASADLEFRLARGEIRMGRVLNPVDALRVFEDIVTFRGPDDIVRTTRGMIKEISGRRSFRMNAVCDSGYSDPHVMLRLYAKPDGSQRDERRWYVDLITDQDEFKDQPCEVRGSDPLVLQSGDDSIIIPLSDVEDIKFAIERSES